MKRSALVGLGLVAGLANVADAQLTMQMGNGWNFTFAGNVNVFYIQRFGSNQQRDGGTGSLVGTPIGEQSNIGTGLLPAFATFSAKGREGNTDLGVHFGFAPQVSQGGGRAHVFGAEAAGAQIDMRQVYLTVGGDWGQVLAGKELGLYQRQNILNDMTLFGAGVNVGVRGTSLGRIGFGYQYTDFRGQITYSTKAGRPYQLSVGIFETTSLSGPDGDAAFAVRQLPRVEAEFVYNTKFSGENAFQFFASGMVQNAKTAVTGGRSQTAVGGSGGVKVGFSGLTLTGSGYYSRGTGPTGMGFADGALDIGTSATGDLRTSYGYYGQITYTAPGSKVTFGGSYGSSRLRLTSAERAAIGNGENALGNTVRENSSIVAMVSYQVTKSYRLVGEFTHAWSQNQDRDTRPRQNQVAAGMMLFY